MDWGIQAIAYIRRIWIKSPKKKKAFFFLTAYTMLFVITFLLAYSPFLSEGKSFIWAASDGRTQHYPVLVYIGRYLRLIVLNFLKGDFSIPLFDLNIGLGKDILSCLNYYGFGDPLCLLSFFVPTRYTEYLYNFLVAFRMYLSGLTFSSMCLHFENKVSYTLK